MSESKLQTKTIKLLEIAGWYVVRVIAASKAGVSDLVCCSPEGRFITIEIKFGGNKLTKLQEYNMDEVIKRNGMAYIVRNIEVVLAIISIHSVQEKV